jgi:organic hydroperoxide reductase OsmC/OhrA
MFLSGVAACSVELIQVFAKQNDITVTSVATNIEARQDPSAQPRQDVSLFTEVQIDIELGGVTKAQAEDLVARFKRR